MMFCQRSTKDNGFAVWDALLDCLNLQGFIPDSKFGFLPGRSGTMACAQTDWIEAKSSGQIVGILAFDFSVAFNTIACPTLLTYLEAANVTGIPLQWFKSYMSDNYQRVFWNQNHNLSEPSPLTHGVPLGPLLLLVMVRRVDTGHFFHTSLTQCLVFDS